MDTRPEVKPEVKQEMKTDTKTESALPTHQRRFISEHSTCAMCDTGLEIRHEINKADLKVKEEAHCPSCGIRVRSSQHLMH